MRTSTIPLGAIVEGSIRGTGDLVVRGTVEGPITLEGTLTIDAAALVRGEVRARSIVVRGTLEGPAHATELIRLESGARLLGDVHAERISAASGALVRGRVRMAGAERLKRTVGGTLEAPFSSVGSIEAPTMPLGPTIRSYVTTPANAGVSSMRTQLTAPAPALDPKESPSLEPGPSARAERLGGPLKDHVLTMAPEPPYERAPSSIPDAMPSAEHVTVPRHATPPPPGSPRPSAEIAVPRHATPPPPASPRTPADEAAPRHATPMSPASPRPSADVAVSRDAPPPSASPRPSAGASPGSEPRERREPHRAAAAKPPAPVVPLLGRVRVRRKGEASP